MSVPLDRTLLYHASQAPGSIITALLILGGAANINKLLPDTNRDSIPQTLLETMTTNCSIYWDLSECS